MERRLRLLVAVAFTAFTIVLTSCGDDDEAAGGGGLDITVENVLGTWTVTDIEISDPLLQALIDEDTDEDVYTFNENGTYVNVYGDETYEGTFAIANGIMTIDAGTEDEGSAEIRELTETRMVWYSEETIEGTVYQITQILTRSNN